jgi:hypothetical protein
VFLSHPTSGLGATRGEGNAGNPAYQVHLWTQGLNERGRASHIAGT